MGAGPDKRNQEITLKDDIVLTIDGSRISTQDYLSVQDYYAPVLTPEEPAGISLTSNDSPSTANYYDLQGRKADKATKGLLIMKSADGKTVKVLKR